MMNYVKADMIRIFKRIPRTVLILVTLAAFALGSFIYVSAMNILADPEIAALGLGFEADPNAVFNAISYAALYVAGLFGLFELIYVFSDDLKAKTAQIAIGVGVSRVKVILSKFFELLILLATDMVLLLGVSILMSGLLGSMMTGAQIFEMIKSLTFGMLVTNIAYSCLVFILIFTTQSMTLAVLGFLALKFHLVSGALGMTDYIKVLRPLNLGSYTLTTMLGKASAMLEGAAFNLIPILAIVAYMGVALIVTSLIYRKKELEF